MGCRYRAEFLCAWTIMIYVCNAYTKTFLRYVIIALRCVKDGVLFRIVKL